MIDLQLATIPFSSSENIYTTVVIQHFPLEFSRYRNTTKAASIKFFETIWKSIVTYPLSINCLNHRLKWDTSIPHICCGSWRMLIP